MKKLIQIGLSSMLVFPVMALGVCATDWNDNTTSMVTYFPVPYAAYNNIYVSDKFDVGTSAKKFYLKLGSDGVSRPALEAYSVTLQNKDNIPAQFKMNSDVYTPTATFGNVKNATGSVTLDFQNLRLGSVLNVSSLVVNERVAVDELQLFGANLGEARCDNGTVQLQRDIDIGAGKQTYVVCCPADSASSCGTPCYFTDAEANSRKPKCLEYLEHPAGSWVQNAQPAPECGCNCPANAYLDANGKCQCNTDYSYSGGSCVLSCSLDWYRRGHRGECCSSYSGSNYSDAACWNLQWQLAEQSYTCSGYSSADNGCSREKLGNMLDWDYPSGNVVEDGDSCTTPNETVERVKYTGASCPSNSDVCGIVQETFKCVNMYEW